MSASRPSAPDPVDTLPGPAAHDNYLAFSAVADDLTRAALVAAGTTGSGRAGDDWAPRAVRTITQGVGSALLADDDRVFLDHLAAELGHSGRGGVVDIQLIGLVDAIAAGLPGDMVAARRVLAAGRDYLRRAIRADRVRAREVLEPAGSVANDADRRPAKPGAPEAATPSRPGYGPLRAVAPAPAATNGSGGPFPSGEPGVAAGQVFADLLLLGALACQTPVAVLSVPQPKGGWSTLSYGFERRDGLNDNVFFDAVAAAHDPIEFADLVTGVPHSPLVLPPHSMRWAYGVALRNGSGQVVGVVAVLDHWLRQLTKREQRAMASLSRQLASHLVQWRRPEAPAAPAERAAVVSPAPAPVAVNGSGPGPGPAGSRLGEPHQLLRSHEVAAIFDVTERTVINWAAGGKLPSLRTIGGHLRFRRDDVMRLLAGAGEPER